MVRVVGEVEGEGDWWGVRMRAIGGGDIVRGNIVRSEE